MTGLWSVIVPESAEVTNLVTNPSFETNTTGWALNGGATIAASSTYQRRGYKSLYVTCSTAVNDGAYYDSVALTDTTAYTLAFDIRASVAFPYLLAQFSDTAGNLVGTGLEFSSDTAGWARKSVSYTATATANYRIRIVKRNNDETAGEFQIDGVGVYALDHDPGHIDGDQEDCWWNGTAHASTSTRKAGSAAGGEVINFDDYSFYVKEFPGAGMANVDPLLQDIGHLPGAIDAGEKLTERVFSLVGHLSGSTQANLHVKRKNLINVLKSDRVPDKQQVKLVYSGGSTNNPTRISAKYIGGLSMGMQDGFTEPVALKFLATDPFWYEDGNGGAALVHSDTVANADYIIRRVDDSWYNVSTNFNSYVFDVAKGNNGLLYIGGNFTAAAGDSNSDYIVSLDSGTLTAMGAGLNAFVTTVKKSPDGMIFVGGNFTAAEGTTDGDGLAYWDTTTAAWKAYNGGRPAMPVHSFDWDRSGNLYVSAQSGTAEEVCVYSSTGWSASIGTFDAVVANVLCGPDGYIYLGGSFGSIDADTSYSGVAGYTGSAFVSLGGGTPGGAEVVYTQCFDDAGNLYIGGSFTSVGGISANRIAKWNGSQWSALGSGLNNNCRALAYHDGLLYAGGQFTSAGGLGLAEGIAIWNGTTWAHLPIDFPGTATIYKIHTDGDDLYIMGDFTGTGYTSYLNTVTNNGTATTYPKIVIKQTGAGAMRPAYIKNETTGATLWLNYPMVLGETLTVDCLNHTITSDYRGNVIGSALLRNSDFASFFLLPGANKISVFCYLSVGTETPVLYATWPITHWSFDGSAI